MGLNVTVQKGHDFSSGNVTRAALNAAATPTIAITGSISGTELADNSVTNAKIPANANISVSKLQLTANNLVIGDSNNKASALAPDGNSNGPTTGKELLVNTGTGFALKGTGTSGDITMDYAFGAVRFTLKDEAVEGRHLNPNSLDEDYLSFSSDRITINNSSIGVNKLKKEGTAGYILTSNGSSKNPEYKQLEIAESPVFETTGAGITYYLVPSGTSKIRVQAVGGGGGGSGDQDSTHYGGGGGGAGAYAESDITVDGNGGVKSLNTSITSAGSNYSTATGLATTTTNGNASGATIAITEVHETTGAIEQFSLVAGGSGYSAGDVLTIVQDGASGGTVTVADVNQAVLRITAGAGGAGVAAGEDSGDGAAQSGGNTTVEYPLTVPSGTPNTRLAQGGTVVLKAAGGGAAPYEGSNTASPSAGGTGGAASDSIGEITISGGNGGTQGTQYLGAASPTDGSQIKVGGHGGHSQWGSPAYNVGEGGLTANVSSIGMGYGAGGNGVNAYANASAESGRRGHVKIFLLN